MVNMCNLILIVINLNLKQDRQSDLCIFMAELDFRRQEKWNETCSDCQIHFSCSCLTDSLIFSDTISSSPPAHRLSQDKSAATWTPAGHSVILSSSPTEYVSVSDTATTHYIFCVCVLLKMELKVGATLQSNPERLVKLVSVVGHNWAMTSSPEWFKIESRLWKAPFRPEWTTELFFWNSSLGFFF